MKKLIFCLLILIGCRPDVLDVPDVKDTDKCMAAEVKLERMRCFDSLGDPMWVNRLGERFGETCRLAQEEGGVFLNPGCVVESDSCEEANLCPVIVH